VENVFTGDIHKKHSFECPCSMTHASPIEEMVIGPGVIRNLPAVIEHLGIGKNVLVVSDTVVMNIAGKRVIQNWENAGLSVTTHVFRLPLVPDEHALGSVLIAASPGCDCIVGLGGGSITDIVRYVASRLGIPHIPVPTAMTHDGFFTDMALLIVDGIKTTIMADPPAAVIADLEIISGAPGRMNAAGLGEMSSKVTALADWYAASVIRGELYCTEVERLMREAVDQAFAAAEGISRGDLTALGSVTDALYKSAVDMYWYGSARTGAGAEHHLTHYWVMRHNLRGVEPNLHGEEVGVASVLVLDMWERILAIDETTFDRDAAVAGMQSRREWEAAVRKGYGDAAGGILRTQKNKSFDPEERRNEIQAILNALPRLRNKFADFLPSWGEQAQRLKAAGAPYTPAQLHVTREEIIDSVLYAKEQRSKYTSLWVADALGLLPELSVALADDAQKLAAEH
jgi:glycerol-1-phosphate dehydrogenase [NAD(P)+]